MMSSQPFNPPHGLNLPMASIKALSPIKAEQINISAESITLTHINLEELSMFAKVCAHTVNAGDRLYLNGHLGAGKTTFVQQYFRFLGIRRLIKSPTYTLIQLYEETNPPLAHMDLYRLNTPYELPEAGLLDYFSPPYILCVEWPNKAQGVIPEPMLTLDWLSHLNIDSTIAVPMGSLSELQADHRTLTLKSHNARGKIWLEQIAQALKLSY